MAGTVLGPQAGGARGPGLDACSGGACTSVRQKKACEAQEEGSHWRLLLQGLGLGGSIYPFNLFVAAAHARVWSVAMALFPSNAVREGNDAHSDNCSGQIGKLIISGREKFFDSLQVAGGQA